jgi:hypothetical protein
MAPFFCKQLSLEPKVQSPRTPIIATDPDLEEEIDVFLRRVAREEEVCK